MQRTKKITNYTILLDKKLGEGAFGKVYIGEQDKTKLKVAIKVIERKKIDANQYLQKALFSEIGILKSLKSPNIVRFLDVLQSNNHYYIIQEFCDGGQLRKMMSNKGKIPEKEAIPLLTQICNGFVELIKQGVMHRDLKPENILIHEGVLKIADFGFSKKVELKKVVANTMVGTPLYMAIQILKNTPYSSKCDIWSLGLVFYQMLMGRTPWIASSEFDLIQNIQSQPLTFPVQISDCAKDFIRKCCALQQKDRLSWDQLLRHPIFKGYFNTKDKQFENKYKALMNHIRYEVKSKNIDFENIFLAMGYSRNNPMTLKSFHKLLMAIAPDFTQQQVKYIFDKINQSGTGNLTVDQFSVAIDKFQIPKSIIKGPSTLQNLNKKVVSAFQKLLEKLSQQNKSLFYVFDAYQLTQKGTINIMDYQRLLISIDPTFTKQEVQSSFKMFDNNNIQNVSLKDFIDFFTSFTGHIPVRNPSMGGANFVTKGSIISTNSNTSFTTPVTNNYGNYYNSPQNYHQQMMYQQKEWPNGSNPVQSPTQLSISNQNQNQIINKVFFEQQNYNQNQPYIQGIIQNQYFNQQQKN